ncbi:MAG: hypothetical protein KGJ80_07365 [Chloroflexota bacterium]|nr:hypothetical protein [Chloroflexota bacterium]
MILIQILVFLFGAFIVIDTVLSAARTIVVPRGEQVFSSRAVFIVMRRIFNLWIARVKTFEERDRIMGYYAPMSLLALPLTWLALVFIGYMGMFWAVGVPSLEDAFKISGSSLFTLGYAPATDIPQHILAFSEAAIGLALLALFITYLPTMYSSFQRREALVTLLDVRAGSPPSAVEMIERYHRIHGLERLSEMWARWEEWFADLEESHTSLAALIYFRSPVSGRSWVTAAGAVLDGASLAASTLDAPRDPQADLCIRAGFLALRAIADLLHFQYERNPKPTDPISITREEFDAACDRLASKGVPLKPDRDKAWRDFVGWRVNYDTVLLGLADVTMAPFAPWSSDRSKGKARELRRHY